MREGLWPDAGLAPGPQDLDFHSGQAVRVYGILIALLLLLAETEWERFLALAPVLDHWVGRSAVMVFESCLTYREAYPSGSTDFHKSLALYRSAASASLLACGAVYFLGGVLCIGAIRKGAPPRGERAACVCVCVPWLELPPPLPSKEPASQPPGGSCA